MEIKEVLSSRYCANEHFRDIVYEWEDIIAPIIGAKITKDNIYRNNRIVRRLGKGNLFTPSGNSLVFEMNPDEHSGLGKSNIIPFIIDFYIRSPKVLEDFYNAYKHNKAIIISSREVYDYLKSLDCPLPIHHIALSLSDKYAINKSTRYTKKYDLVLVGRQNKVLKRFLDRYLETHLDLYFVFQERTKQGLQLRTNRNEYLSNIETREKYMELLQKAKTVLYSTPGMDDKDGHSQNFNQVTPRLLEYMASGCHILARYPINSDVEFYELPSWLPSIQSYKEFEIALDKARTTEVNMEFYSQYLSKHYTSGRAKELRLLLDTL